MRHSCLLIWMSPWVALPVTCLVTDYMTAVYDKLTAMSSIMPIILPSFVMYVAVCDTHANTAVLDVISMTDVMAGRRLVLPLSSSWQSQLETFCQMTGFRHSLCNLVVEYLFLLISRYTDSNTRQADKPRKTGTEMKGSEQPRRHNGWWPPTVCVSTSALSFLSCVRAKVSY